MKNAIFTKADYQTAAEACIDTMMELELSPGRLDARDRKEYIQAQSALSIMNSSRDMNFEPGWIYAESDLSLWQVKPTEAFRYPNETIKAAIHLHADGTFTDATPAFQ